MLVYIMSLSIDGISIITANLIAAIVSLVVSFEYWLSKWVNAFLAFKQNEY